MDIDRAARSLKMKYKVGDRVYVGRHSEVPWIVEDVKEYLVQLREEGTDYSPAWIDVDLIRGKK